MMSPQHARARTLYVLIALNVALVAAMVAVIVFGVLPLRDQLQSTIDTNRAGCERGNVSRDTQRYTIQTLSDVLSFVQEASTNAAIRAKFAAVTPELELRSQQPAIQHQPCDTLYPR